MMDKPKAKNAFLVELNSTDFNAVMRHCQNNGISPHKFMREAVRSALTENNPVEEKESESSNTK
ncbi:hypothetical protein [Serratia quinivorans]|uniref:hypothetical protein n=1 Tax=Serratia quinivorans TaxID=137545 RepID=UPI00217A98FE|nr:hypothetical protein [Serratia quinivorans]CAI1715564.1 Uncharacterised protein [Serratia quinivorans]CAI1799193.1 Uncharacterised protein [Serratia quinivorans]